MRGVDNDTGDRAYEADYRALDSFQSSTPMVPATELEEAKRDLASMTQAFRDEHAAWDRAARRNLELEAELATLKKRQAAPLMAIATPAGWEIDGLTFKPYEKPAPEPPKCGTCGGRGFGNKGCPDCSGVEGT